MSRNKKITTQNALKKFSKKQHAQSQAEEQPVTNNTNQLIPKIKTPILGPVKISRTASTSYFKSVSDTVKNKINKFIVWILSYNPQEIKGPFNDRVKKLKKIVCDIYNRFMKPEE